MNYLRNRPKLIFIEKHPIFKIKGENDSEPFEIKVTSFMQLTRCPNTAIVTGTVIDGIIAKGNVITIEFPEGNPIDEVAENIQICKQDVLDAIKGQQIGIQLSKTTYKELLTLSN